MMLLLRESFEREEIDTELLARLQCLTDEVQITSHTGFLFSGEKMQGIESNSPEADELAAAVAAAGVDPYNLYQHPMVQQLTQVLYHHGYARVFQPGSESLLGGTDWQNSKLSDEEFVAGVIAAHPSRLYCDQMWKVGNVEPNGTVDAGKAGERVVRAAGQYTAPQVFGRAPNVGEFIEFSQHPTSTDTQPGFIHLFSETVPGVDDDFLLSRFYFNTRPEFVPELVRELMLRFNRLRIPVRMKCLANPEFYNRTDAVVLYIGRRFVPATLQVFANVDSMLDASLEAGTPLCSRVLRPGLGCADEPGNSQSFGQTRCQLISVGLIGAWIDGSQNWKARMEHIYRAFWNVGLELSRPYLSEGMADIYHWPIASHRSA